MEQGTSNLEVAGLEEEVATLVQAAKDLVAEVSKVIVGQGPMLDGVLTALISNGHVLLEGVPGLGKTLTVQTLSRSLALEHSRIQFTPDLMPADITGTDVIDEDPETGRRKFSFRKGPVFTNILLADEINRATPKTQSALLECMQERQITIGGTCYELGAPFFVLATQNPIEMEGTYPLPEAQMDRFISMLRVTFPSADDLAVIVDRTCGMEAPKVEAMFTGEQLLRLQSLSREVVLSPEIRDHAVRLILNTHPGLGDGIDEVAQMVRYGSSPRGLQAIILESKARALLDGRYHVSMEDITSVAPDCLRHRVLLSFEGESRGVSTDEIVAAIIAGTPSPFL